MNAVREAIGIGLIFLALALFAVWVESEMDRSPPDVVEVEP
jgi:hypothetical protein